MSASELSEISYMYIDHCHADVMVFITLSQLKEGFKDGGVNTDYIEHYFENLLFDGKDPINRYYLTDEQAEAVEICAGYVYELFGNMCEIFDFLESKKVEDD